MSRDGWDDNMQVQYDSPYGQLIWTLPQEASDVLSQAPAEVRTMALEAFGSHLTILCGAMLKSFGNPGMVDTVNLIMREMREIVERNAEDTDGNNRKGAVNWP